MSEANACEECTEKCLLIHKRNRDPSPIVSSFFKIIIDDRFLRFLPVPPRFAPRLASLMDQETRVEDSSGREWAVTLSTVNGRLGFEKGWNAFSLDHGIELGDLLVFHYILDSHFVVQIYGRSACEKLTLPSENNTVQNNRIRTTADGPSSNRSDKDSGSGLATIPSKKGNLEEPCLMMVDRDTHIAGEEERILLFDMFASEIGNIKADAKVDNVQKGNGSSNAEDMVDNHNNAVEDVLKDRIDANDTREGNGDLEMNILKLESAMGLELPEQLHNGSSNDNILDYDTAFDDLLEDAQNVKMSEINEKGKNGYQWPSEIDHKSNIATKFENRIWKTNPTDLPLGVLNVTEQNSKVHISSGHRVDEPKSAFGGNRSMGKRSYQEISSSVAAIPVSESNGQSLKVVKTEHKEINQELDVGSEQESNITAHENLNAATNAAEVRQTMNAEPVDHTPLQVSCTVTPNNKFFLEIPEGLPIGRAEVEEMIVILRDSVGRRWPVLYHEKNGSNALVYGWKSFSRANGIRSGDKCVFTLEDQFEPLCRVQIIHK